MPQIFSHTFFFFSFWDSYNWNVGIIPEVSETVLISFYSLLLLFHSASVIYTILSSISLICFSASATVTLLLGSSAAAAAARSLQLCLTLCNIDGSPPGSTIPGILQARTLEWVAISFSNAWKWKVKVKLHSRVLLLVTPRTAAYQALPSMGFSRQEYWSGLPLLSLIGSLWYILNISYCIVLCRLFIL